MRLGAINKEDAKNFLCQYKAAKEKNVEPFYFHGEEFILSYAAYIVEYFRMKNLLDGEVRPCK